MNTKQLKTMFVRIVAVTVVLLIALSVTGGVSAVGSQPFVGQWQAIDVDGSDIRLTIAGSPSGPFQITWTESYISFCNGEAGIVQGTGRLSEGNSYILEADLHLECFTTGKSTDFHKTWFYDPMTDTISSDDITWHRSSGPLPSRQSWVAAFTYDLPAGTWNDGTYPYHFEFEWSVPEPGGAWIGQGGEFVISSDAPLYDGFVLLRGAREIHRVVAPGGPVCEDVESIHPDQPMRFLVGWVPGVDTIISMTYPEALAHFESISARVVWDDGMSAELVRHEIIPLDLWPQRVCTFTQ